MLGNVFTNNYNQWLVNLQISHNKKLVPFLVDSGADIVCIPSNHLDSILLKSLKNCSETISGPDGTKLKVLGKITERLSYPSKGKSCTFDIFVIQDLKMPILGRPGISCLEVLNFSINSINQTSSTNVQVEKEFPDIFNEIGNFKDEINIEVCEEAKPFVQTTPRVVPIPLLGKLEK
uniref:Uncharacterized protein LOC114336389 n=1 Tax=Diabrotica virgifera virgifera TaxID=50390 RepID=A0A6P7G0X4_DIAVI